MRRLPWLVRMALFLQLVPSALLAQPSEKKVSFCVNAVGLYQISDAELVSALGEMIKKLGFAAEGKVGPCQTGDDLFLEIRLVRVGNQLTVTIIRKESGGGVTCEKSRADVIVSPENPLDSFQQDLAACLPRPENKPAATEKSQTAEPPQPASPDTSPPKITTKVAASVSVEAEKPKDVVVTADSDKTPPSLSATMAPAPPPRVRLGRIIFWSGLGLGAAGAAAMIFAEKEYRAIKRDLSGSEGTVAALGGTGIGALALGGAAVAVGIGLWLWPAGEAKPISLSAALLPQGSALVFSADW